jgi:hypothetical protein
MKRFTCSLGMFLAIVVGTGMGCEMMGPAGSVHVTDPSGAVVEAEGIVQASAFEAGEYTIQYFTPGKPVSVVKVTITKDGIAPSPTPSPRPGPGPTPTPAPIKEPGLRVLIVEETANRGNLPYSQGLIFGAIELHDWADKHCSKDSAGKSNIRIFDKDADLEHESDLWKKAMQFPRDSVPWLIVSNGVSGESVPLPSDLPSLMEVLRKYE